jgi:hypothetical protein
MNEGIGRKTPIRMCVACRESSDKRALLRIVRRADGQVLVDPTGKASGRGAYLCGAKECLKQAIKGKKLAKALRCDIPADLIRDLEDRLLPTGAEQRSDNGDRAMNAM